MLMVGHISEALTCRANDMLIITMHFRLVGLVRHPPRAEAGHGRLHVPRCRLHRLLGRHVLL